VLGENSNTVTGDTKTPEGEDSPPHRWGNSNRTVTAWFRGFSEAPCVQDVERWVVLTIGTGLGNARFTNRNGKSEK